MTQILRRPFTDARIVDRGAYASVYQLIDDIYAKFPPSRALTPVLIRVSTRPVYNDVAIDQERQKITTYVATLNLIHGMYHFSVRIISISSLLTQHFPE
jgi:heat shock protein HspQ